MAILSQGPSLLVGRGRELALLREHLTAALAGRGSLVLVGGEAGIGKTSLCEAVCREGVACGALALVGRCYDLTETPPYGPWVELFGHYPPGEAMPPLLEAFAARGAVRAVASQDALFRQVSDFLAAICARQPLLLLLDDLHWADPASLDLLRVIARSLATLPLLLIATYRSDELTRRHALYQLLPLLVREAGAERLTLGALDDGAVRVLVERRYRLAGREADRLIAYLQGRAEGNALFTGEVLRSLEERGVLAREADGWRLGDLTGQTVPALLRQVIEGRAGRLDSESQRLLSVAAVIGQEVPLAVWVAVAGVSDEFLLPAIEEASAARFIEATADGAAIRFAHALIREALYEGMLPPRRRALHRIAGEALAARKRPDADAVAYHFQRAGDERAAEWYSIAGEQAYRANAWLTAADRFETALGLLEARGAETSKCGWLRYRLAVLRRFDNAAPSLAALEEARRLADKGGDRALAAFAQVMRGYLHCSAGNPLRGLPELEAGVLAVEALPPEELARPEVQESVDWTIGRGTLAMHSATSGHLMQARDMAERFIAAAESAPEPAMPHAAYGDAFNALGYTWSQLGDAEKSREGYERCIALYRSLDHPTHVGNVLRQLVQNVLLPYQTEAVAERQRLIAEAEGEWGRARGVRASLAPRISDVPLMVAEGRSWPEARDLAYAASTASVSQMSVQQMGRSLLVTLLVEQGEWEEAHALLAEWLPEGPETPFGAKPFGPMMTMQRLAARLALEAGDTEATRRWLEANNHWLTRSGAILGRSEGQALWSEYYRESGDAARAFQHAERALAHATEPRQPRALIPAHRLLGEIHTDAGRFDDATRHLHAALALAERCALSYHYALTLLALAALHAAQHDREEAQRFLDAARALLIPLDAKPALVRADALEESLARAPSAASTYPAGLTAREVEVLRLVAAGRSNRQIADTLFISERTVNRHMTNLYTKIDAHSKADATAWAIRHHLA